MISRVWLGLASAVLALTAAADERSGCAACDVDASIEVPAAADMKATAARLLLPTNAQRLEAVQAILRERGLKFELQAVPNTHTRGDSRTEGQNVIVTVGEGSGPIVVGAHFDAAALQGGKLSGGMVDNAGSVAVLAHMATEVRKRPLRHRVQFVFFDLEEVGLVGSRHFVNSPLIDGALAMINMDTLHGADTLIYGPASHSGNDVLYRALARICASAALSCLEFPEYPPSDDRSFQDGGVPNVSLAVLPRTEAHQLWLMLNGGRASGLAPGFTPEVLRSIHTPADQLDRLDPDALAIAYRAAMGLLLQLDRDLP